MEVEVGTDGREGADPGSVDVTSAGRAAEEVAEEVTTGDTAVAGEDTEGAEEGMAGAGTVRGIRDSCCDDRKV